MKRVSSRSSWRQLEKWRLLTQPIQIDGLVCQPLSCYRIISFLKETIDDWTALRDCSMILLNKQI